MNDILMHTADNILTLTLNRPDKKNSITAAMYSALAEALLSAQDNPEVRVVLIQGDSSIFSAGNDLKDFLNAPPEREDAPVHRFLQSIASFPKPIVAAVNGPAVGIGTTMLLHCDLVYAGENALFSLPFVNLGLCPEAGSSLLLPQMLGYHRAAAALLLGEPLDAQAALAAGLVNQVVPPAEVKALALKQAQKLAAKPLTALTETKRLMRAGLGAVLAQMQQEQAAFAQLLQAPAAREAFSAFLEKRQPDFGRF